jgi:hypothetical protein
MKWEWTKTLHQFARTPRVIAFSSGVKDRRGPALSDPFFCPYSLAYDNDSHEKVRPTDGWQFSFAVIDWIETRKISLKAPTSRSTLNFECWDSSQL